MAFTYLTTDANGNPGRVHLGSFELNGLGARPNPHVSMLTWDAVLVDLENTAYVTDGIPIPVNTLGFRYVYNMFVLGGKDPYGVADVTPPDGLVFLLDTTDPRNPLLVINDADGEIDNDDTQTGESVWLVIGGLK